jgi:integrase
MKRRGRGEGSIFQRKTDGRWVGSVDWGWSNGKRQRKQIVARTHAEIVEKMTRALAKKQSGAPLVDERTTLAAYLARWLEDSARSALRPRTYVSYKMICERHLIPGLGRKPLARLKGLDIQGYLNAKLAGDPEAGVKRLSARTVQYHYAVLRHALNQAEGWELIPRSPAHHLVLPRVERPEIRPLTPEQVREVLAAVDEDRLSCLYHLAAGVGARQGELLALRWSDFDAKAATLRIAATLQRYDNDWHLDKPKTDRSNRVIALPAALVERLSAHRGRQLAEKEKLLRLGDWHGERWGGLIFATETGEPLLGTVITHSFQKLLKRLGLPRQRWHDLRHFCATYLLDSGVDLKTTSVLLGHSNIGVTADTYGHSLPERQREGLERVSALLAPAGGS